MKKDKQSKKSSEKAFEKSSEKVFEQAFDREFDVHIGELAFDVDKEEFVSNISEEEVKKFYFKVAKRFCAIVVAEVVFKGDMKC